jgi:hypothetical protein
MKAPFSAMAAGHSATLQKTAALHRNWVLSCSGLGCLLPPESDAFLQRILHDTPPYPITLASAARYNRRWRSSKNGDITQVHGFRPNFW